MTSLLGLSSLFLCFASTSCSEAIDLPERDDPEVKEVFVEEPIAFTTDNYQPPPQGSPLTSIADLNAKFGPLEAEATRLLGDPRGSRVWQAFDSGSPFPVQGDCEPERDNDQVVLSTETLPVTIEGVVTLHPRFFNKTGICGSDQRFYGSFFIQDHSGGVFIWRDSRVSEFTFGDRVRLRVKGVARSFDLNGVLAFDQFEVLTTPETRQPITYEVVNTRFDTANLGKVMRIRGKVTSLSTNNNFNEMTLEGIDTPWEWFVSLDRELGQRNPPFKLGQVVEITGPLVNNFGLRLLVSSYGQINFNPDSN